MSNTSCALLACGNTATLLCTGCRRASYCSELHQKQDRPRHKGLCRAVTRTNGCNICANINNLLHDDPKCKAVNSVAIHVDSTVGRWVDQPGTMTNVTTILVIHRLLIPPEWNLLVGRIFEQVPLAQFAVLKYPNSKAVTAYPTVHYPEMVWSTLPGPLRRSILSGAEPWCVICRSSSQERDFADEYKYLQCVRCASQVCRVCTAKSVKTHKYIAFLTAKQVPHQCSVCRVEDYIVASFFTDQATNTAQDVYKSLVKLWSK